MSTCLVARTAVIALRKRSGGEPRLATVVFPAKWKRAALLAYCRHEHPVETVRIVDWRPTRAEGEWEPSLWLCNPEGFADYRTGELA